MANTSDSNTAMTLTGERLLSDLARDIHQSSNNKAEHADSFYDISSLYEKLGITKLNCGHGDWLSSWLIKFGGFKLVLLSIGIPLFSLITIFLTIVEGNFHNPALAVQGSQAYGLIVQNVIGLPALLLLIGRYIGSFPDTLLRLCVTGVFRLTKKDWQRFVDCSHKL